VTSRSANRLADLTICCSFGEDIMLIPGIPDEHLERLHLYLGPGKGSAYAYRHLPSGITVCGEIPPDMNVYLFDRKLVADLAEQLKAAGFLTGTGT
jgi:hypothetical protein